MEVLHFGVSNPPGGHQDDLEQVEVEAGEGEERQSYLERDMGYYYCCRVTPRQLQEVVVVEDVVQNRMG